MASAPHIDDEESRSSHDEEDSGYSSDEDPKQRNLDQPEDRWTTPESDATGRRGSEDSSHSGSSSGSSNSGAASLASLRSHRSSDEPDSAAATCAALQDVPAASGAGADDPDATLSHAVQIEMAHTTTDNAEDDATTRLLLEASEDAASALPRASGSSRPNPASRLSRSSRSSRSCYLQYKARYQAVMQKDGSKAMLSVF